MSHYPNEPQLEIATVDCRQVLLIDRLRDASRAASRQRQAGRDPGIPGAAEHRGGAICLLKDTHEQQRGLCVTEWLLWHTNVFVVN